MPPVFRPLTLGDRDLVTSYVRAAGLASCMYNFAQIYANQPLYAYELAEHDGHLFIFNAFRGKHYFPLGAAATPENLLNWSRQLGGVAFHYAPGAAADGFEVSSDEGDFEYIYATRALAELSDSAFRKKRNLVLAFQKVHPDASARALTAQDVGACLALMQDWGTSRRQPDEADAFFNECIAIEATGMRYALDHFEALQLDAFGLFVGDRLVAFDVFSGPVDSLIHVTYEKYDVTVPNCVPILRKLAARYLLDQGYEAFNFGRDIGLPGLRKSKRAYHPQRMLRTHTLTPLSVARLEVNV
ncbi:MAG: hypothetical protein JWM80_4841 [Cyanobacteria bacterium RYN_339]|nr:hypothetical protein [Cyanobacteria bacterium RYN_339]